MIFDESYDKALWLILHSDQQNRYEIVCFINSLTDEMYQFIHSFINDYYDDKNTFISRKQLLRDDFSLEVEIYDDELTISVHRWDNDGDYFLEEKTELSLMPLCDEQIQSMKHLEQTRVGNFSYNLSLRRNHLDSTYKDHRDAEYVLTKRLYGYNLDIVNPYMDYHLGSKKINIKSIPNKIYPHQFKNVKKVDRLVRARRKR